MDMIKLLYAKNVFSRKSLVRQQNLSFVILVENLAFDKKIDVKWAGENGVWHTLPAIYHSSVGQEKEYWIARMAFVLAADESLPGNVQFALRYRVAEAEYWDNNQGENYCIQADSGIKVGHENPVLNVGFESSLSNGERRLPITVAVDRKIKAEKVTIDWTIDNWKSKQQSTCRLTRNYWDTECLSNARNP
ncbi:MAG TPA: endonuclease, partial [Lentisphaeria bacterium]|nr:endonuclease [Lentisphaeria bacterium]